MSKSSLNFISVDNSSEDHINALYDLLKNREHSISHQSIPNIEDHKNFVQNHPYRAWFLIQESDNFIGSVYVTDQNTIGVPNILDESNNVPIAIRYIQDHFDPLPPIPSVRQKNFVINISPNYDALKTAIEKMGGKMIQVTYKI